MALPANMFMVPGLAAVPPVMAAPPRTAASASPGPVQPPAPKESPTPNTATTAVPPSIAAADSVVMWDVPAVATWLVNTGYAAYEMTFLENGISGDVLVRLDDALLRDLGFDKVGPRIALLKAIYALKRAHGVPFEPGDYIPQTVLMLSEMSDAAVGENGRLQPSLPAPEGKSKKSLFSLFESHSHDADPQKLAAAFRQQTDSVTRLTADVAKLHAELAQLKDDLAPVMVMSREYQAILDRERRRAGGNAPSIASVPSIAPSTPTVTPTPARKKSPVVSMRSPPPIGGDSDVPEYGTIKVFGDRLHHRAESEGYKSFKVHRDDACATFVPVALKKYKLAGDASQYALFVAWPLVPGGERCLAYDECPWRVYLEYISQPGAATSVQVAAAPMPVGITNEPYFILRHIKPQSGSPLARDDGSGSVVGDATDSTPPPPRTPGSPPSTPHRRRSQYGAAVALMSPTMRAATGLMSPPPPATTSPSGMGPPPSAAAQVQSTPTASSARMSPPRAATPPRSADAIPAPTESSRAVAVYEYRAQRADEVSVMIGDPVVIRHRSVGWFVVDTAAGATGWVPSGCLVEEALAEEYATGPAAGPAGVTLGRALFPYDAIGPNELSIKKGDTMRLMKRYEHWVLADLNGTTGWVPVSYIKLVQKKARPASPAPDLFRAGYGDDVGGGGSGRPAPLPSASSSSSLRPTGSGTFGSQVSTPTPTTKHPGHAPSDRRLDSAVQDLMTILARKQADAAIAGTVKDEHLIGTTMNLLHVLAQLPPSSPRYPLAVDRIDRLHARIEAGTITLEDLHTTLTELVASTVAMPGANTRGSPSPGPKPTPPPRVASVTPPPNMTAMAAAAAAASGHPMPNLAREPRDSPTGSA
ncbi:Adaptor for signal transduction [Allomyces arbusculus]|nr:Adaptor for signal transduction [Allomyces arbusculus]